MDSSPVVLLIFLFQMHTLFNIYITSDAAFYILAGDSYILSLFTSSVLTIV